MKMLQIKWLSVLFFFSVSMYAQNSDNSDDEIYTIVQEMPRFPGCEGMEGTQDKKKQCAEQQMLEFIYKNIKYPQVARENGIEGMTVVSFVVEKDGSMSDARILRDLGGGCGKESLRIVNEMPNWIPGKHKGEPVRVQFNMPIRFKLEGGPKLENKKPIKKRVKKPIKKREMPITFTLRNDTRKDYVISTPSGIVTIPSGHYQQFRLKKGVQLTYRKKSKNAKSSITITKDLEGKIIDMKSISKKR